MWVTLIRKDNTQKTMENISSKYNGNIAGRRQRRQRKSWHFIPVCYSTNSTCQTPKQNSKFNIYLPKCPFSNPIFVSIPRPFLLECPTQEIRGAFARIIVNIIQSCIHHTTSVDSIHLDKTIEYLLSLLDKEVPDHCRTCGQYFWLLSVYLEKVSQFRFNYCSFLSYLHVFPL